MSPRVFVIQSVIVALTALPASSPAQSTTSLATPIAAGTRVRVATVQLGDAITGVVVSHSADSLVVKSDKDSSTVALASAQVARVDVSRGRHTQRRKGATIGFLSGTGIGALVGYATYKEPASCADGGPCFGPFGPGFEAAAGAAMLGAVGVLVGTVVGSFEREQWRPAPRSLPRDARIDVAPAHGGIALTASITF